MTSRPTRSYRGYDFSLTEKILGACIEVHRTLGPGFQQIIYQRALELEFATAGLEFQREVDVPVYYKGQKISYYIIKNLFQYFQGPYSFNIYTL